MFRKALDNISLITDVFIAAASVCPVHTSLDGQSFLKKLSSITVFLRATVFEKCRIKMIQTSIYHMQSNRVERVHSILKWVLQALCFEYEGS